MPEMVELVLKLIKHVPTNFLLEALHITFHFSKCDIGTGRAVNMGKTYI
jgi:hypothetical protein